ncbi:MAG: hypothetical protein O3A02_00150 [bacterium]|nr:hypothetical protein [bacterium]
MGGLTVRAFGDAAAGRMPDEPSEQAPPLRCSGATARVASGSLLGHQEPDARTDDVDGETQERRGTISVFDGPEPRVERFADADSEARAVGAWLSERVAAGARPHEIGVFVRHEGLFERAHAALAHAGLEGTVLDDAANPPEGHVALATMHRAKGLEYRAVAVVACDEDVLPLADRLATASDMNELQEVHETERHLLYVAVTRARDELWVSGVAPGSDYLADL